MDSEFEKRMKLLDPGYVVPDSERVKNRKAVSFHAEKPRFNEAGLEIKEDTPVDSGLQKLYLRRMMDADALDKLIEKESGGAITEAEYKKMKKQGMNK